MTHRASFHPTENRGYRELYVTSRALARHLQNLAVDRFFERHQALRLAVAEIQHVRTLLAYHRVAYAAGAIGEWVDRRAARRRSAARGARA